MKRRALIIKGSAVAAAGLVGGAAVAQTIPAVPRTSPSIFDFGARGDGLSDDSWAFAAALQVAANEGRKIFVPAFTYSIADTIRFTSAANVTRQWGLHCEGAILQSKIKIGNDVMSFTSNHIVRYFSLTGGLTIKGTRSDKNGIRIFASGPGGKHFYNFLIDEVSVEGVGGHGLLLEGNVFECQIQNSYFQDCGLNGATFAHSNAGVCSSVNVIGCYFNQNGQHGMQATTFDSQFGGTTDVRVIGGYCRENQQYGFYYNNGTSQGASVQQVGFENNCKSKQPGDPNGAHVFANTRMQMRDCTGYNEFGGATYLLRGYFSALTALDGCSQTSGGAMKATGKSRLMQINGPASGHVVMRECVGGFDVVSGAGASWQAVNCVGLSPLGDMPVKKTLESA